MMTEWHIVQDVEEAILSLDKPYKCLWRVSTNDTYTSASDPYTSAKTLI
jgi:hypothetical protein